VEAVYRYGLCFEGGKCVRADLAKAFGYYKLAADQNRLEGQCKYGRCLLFWKGTTQHVRLAAEYFKLMADRGYVPSQYVCEILYRDMQLLERMKLKHQDIGCPTQV
jgi:TPR repeat protein